MQEMPLVPRPRTSQKVILGVTGMTCAVCSGTIERGLSCTDGIISCKVSLLTEKAEVVYNPLIIQPEAICSEIEDLGFDAEISSIQSQEGKRSVQLGLGRAVSDTESAEVHKFLLAMYGVLGVKVQEPLPLPSISGASSCNCCAAESETHFDEAPLYRQIVNIELSNAEGSRLPVRDVIKELSAKLGDVRVGNTPNDTNNTNNPNNPNNPNRYVRRWTRRPGGSQTRDATAEE